MKRRREPEVLPADSFRSAFELGRSFLEETISSREMARSSFW